MAPSRLAPGDIATRACCCLAPALRNFADLRAPSYPRKCIGRNDDSDEEDVGEETTGKLAADSPSRTFRRRTPRRRYISPRRNVRCPRETRGIKPRTKDAREDTGPMTAQPYRLRNRFFILIYIFSLSFIFIFILYLHTDCCVSRLITANGIFVS